jgi:hypothetical protein
MSDLVKRLRTKHFFSDSVMASRMPEDEMAIDIMRSERKEAADHIEVLEAALRNVVEANTRFDDGKLRDTDYGQGIAVGLAVAAKIARAALAPEQDK